MTARMRTAIALTATFALAACIETPHAPPPPVAAQPSAPPDVVWTPYPPDVVQSLREEADLMDSVRKVEPTLSASLAKSVREVAMRLDDAAVALRDSDPSVAEDLASRAARVYEWIVAPRLAHPGLADAGELRAVGDRLFALGRIVDHVPEDRASFVGWTSDESRDQGCWKKAAATYEAALAALDFWERAALLGRTYGFLKQWPDAVRVYEKLFADEPMLTKDKRRLDPGVVEARHGVVFAYVEWGAAERAMFDVDHDEARLRRCRDLIRSRRR